jgi:hypothetical protein
MEGTTATSQTQYCCSRATHWPSRICAKLRRKQRSFDTIILFNNVLHFKGKMWLWLGMSGETFCMVISYWQYDCIYSTNQPLHANPWTALAVLIWMELHDCMLYCDLQWSAKPRLISQSIGHPYHPLIWSHPYHPLIWDYKISVSNAVLYPARVYEIIQSVCLMLCCTQPGTMRLYSQCV